MKASSKPRLYSDVNVLKSPGEIDYSQLHITWGKQENYEILRKLGRGKYSDVYEGLDMISQKKVVIKILKPIRKSKVLREIKVLKVLEHVAGVPSISDIVKDNSTKTPSIIFQHMDSQEFLQVVAKAEELDVKFYLWEILRILDSAHSNGIIHRDLKPSNILVDHSKRYLQLIDWGLGEFYLPDKPLNCRVASRYYKSPELLMGYENYDYSIDMWAFGALLASVIFKKHPFFHGHDNYDQLVKIVRTLGTVPFLEYLEKYGIPLDERYEDLRHNYSTKPWQKFTNPESKLASPEALDLLSKVLVYDHQIRLLPAEALRHSYFTPVREMLEKVQTAGAVPDGNDTFSILVARKLGIN
jgi:casein kinase II subunit alpha